MFRHIVPALLWVLLGGYVVFAVVTSRRARAVRLVGRLEIVVKDSTSKGYLVTSERVRSWIEQSDIPTLGTTVDAVDLTAVEQLIARNGFVKHVAAHVAHDGTLHVDIEPRRPLLRLVTEGRNVYVTRKGYVFAMPRASSLYVPVVTGPYEPPFPADYVGDIRAWVDAEHAKIGRRIDELEREKYPLYRRGIDIERRKRELRRRRISKGWRETPEAFESRVAELREVKVQQRRRYRYEARLVQAEIDGITERQEAQRERQKKLEKSYEDFMKLLTFVEQVEDDDFWRSEVVQVIARTTPSGALEVDLIPRSGNFRVRFGRLENEEEKFDKLLNFYRRGLTKVGWDTYRTIDVRFGDQVVCHKSRGGGTQGRGRRICRASVGGSSKSKKENKT